MGNWTEVPLHVLSAGNERVLVTAETIERLVRWSFHLRIINERNKLDDL